MNKGIKHALREYISPVFLIAVAWMIFLSAVTWVILAEMDRRDAAGPWPKIYQEAGK